MRVFKAQAESEEDKVVEVNARVIPKDLKIKKGKKTFGNMNTPSTTGVVGRKRSLDPRFDHIYGAINPNHVNERYAFLKEKASEENSERFDRLKKLRQAKRRLNEELENGDDDDDDDDEMLKTGGGSVFEDSFKSDPVLRQIGKKVLRQKAAFDYDEGFGDDEDEEEEKKKKSGEGGAEVDDIVKNSSIREVKREMADLQEAASQYKQQVSQQKANDRMRQVKSKLAKKEMEAVKNNEKLQPFFANRKELKKEVERERFVELEKKGGRKMVEAYAEKMKKKTRKHMD